MKLFAKKSLGQHFLNSPHVLETIVSAAELTKGEHVLEIGPGTGILTEALLRAHMKVTAIEKDHRAVELLQQKFSNEITNGALHLIEGDILAEHDIATPFAVVANIPYYITGAILEKFLEYEPRPSRMVLLVQKEVAERIVAREGGESVLSISVKAFGNPRIVAKVPRGAFTPPPTVDSAVLAIKDISDVQFKQKNLVISRFFQVLKAGFAHKRKFLIRNLETVISPEKLNQIWKDLAIDPKIRPENVTTQTWIEIASR